MSFGFSFGGSDSKPPISTGSGFSFGNGVNIAAKTTDQATGFGNGQANTSFVAKTTSSNLFGSNTGFSFVNSAPTSSKASVFGGAPLFGSGSQPSNKTTSAIGDLSSAKSTASSLFGLVASKPTEPNSFGSIAAKATPPIAAFSFSNPSRATLTAEKTSTPTASPSTSTEGSLFGAASKPSTLPPTSTVVSKQNATLDSGITSGSSFTAPFASGKPASSIGLGFAKVSDPVSSVTSGKPAVQPSAGTFSLNQPFTAPTARSTNAFSVNSTKSENLRLSSSTTPGSRNKVLQPLSTDGKPATHTNKSGAFLPVAKQTSSPDSQLQDAANMKAKLPITATSLKYKDLETKINKWTGDLENQERIILEQATQVNYWNNILMGNSEKITDLSSDLEKVTLDQDRLTRDLDFIEAQQDELESLLVPLEEALQQQSSERFSVHTHSADVEREKSYNLAENIDEHLKRMVQELKEVIDHVNTTNSSQDSNPVDQFSKILSAHMDSLQWLNTNSGSLQQKLDELAKEVDDRTMEQESRLNLAFE